MRIIHKDTDEPIANAAAFGHDWFMTSALKKEADALVAKLAPRERLELADLLYAGLPRSYTDAVERAWNREIKRRLDDYRSGRTKTIPSEERRTA